MNTQYLAVTHGLPGSGKSQVAKKLAGNGFVRINPDDLRTSFYGKDFGNISSKEENFLASYAIPVLRDWTLLRGEMSVVIDTCAATEHFRKYLFSTSEGLEETLAQKGTSVERYLIKVEAHPEVLVRRVAQRDKVSEGESKRRIDEMARHTEPVKLDDRIKLLEYENNTPADLKNMLADIDQRFGGAVA